MVRVVELRAVKPHSAAGSSGASCKQINLKKFSDPELELLWSRRFGTTFSKFSATIMGREMHGWQVDQNRVHATTIACR